MIPACRYCQRPMQLNAAASTATVTQYMCACRGAIYFVNAPNWKPPLELRKPRR
jgi:hypothetical protein